MCRRRGVLATTPGHTEKAFFSTTPKAFAPRSMATRRSSSQVSPAEPPAAPMLVFGGDVRAAHAFHSIEPHTAVARGVCPRCTVSKASWQVSPASMFERSALHRRRNADSNAVAATLLCAGLNRTRTANALRRREPHAMSTTCDSWRCREGWAAGEEAA